MIGPSRMSSSGSIPLRWRNSILGPVAKFLAVYISSLIPAAHREGASNDPGANRRLRMSSGSEGIQGSAGV